MICTGISILSAVVSSSTRAAPRHCRHDIRPFGLPISSRKCVRRLTRRIDSREVRRWIPCSWLKQPCAQTVRKMQRREDIYSRVFKCSMFSICRFKYTKPSQSDYLSTCCNHIMSACDLSRSQTTGISQWNKQQEINNDIPCMRWFNNNLPRMRSDPYGI